MDETRTDHYVQLISNASMGVSRQRHIRVHNTISATKLRPSGQWEVGMHSCSYHRNWLNITEADEANMEITLGNWHGPQSVMSPFVKSKLTLPYPGNYSTPQSLIDAMMKMTFRFKIQEMTRSVTVKLCDFVDMTFNTSTQRMTVHWKRNADVQSDTVLLTFSKKIRKMMGMRFINPANNTEQDYIFVGNPEQLIPSRQSAFPFPPFTPETMRPSVEFDDPVNFVDVFNLFVYTDIVKATRLGDGR